MLDVVAPRRVVVVDDHRTFCELLTMALAGHPSMECVGIAHDPQTATTLVDLVDPDVLVMDYRLGDHDGVELTRRLTSEHPALGVVVLTAYPTRDVVLRAAEAGASAVLPKDGSLDDLLDALLVAEPGRFAVPPAVLRLISTPETPRVGPDLTPRELEVLELLAAGRDVRRIARVLGITVNTTRGHVKSILVKLGVHSQLEAVALAHRDGLLAPRAPA